MRALGNAAAIVDPGGSADLILNKIKQEKLDVKMILLTHGHFDHVMGVPDLLAAYPDLPVYITETDYPEARDGGQFGYRMGEVSSVQFYDEGDTVELGRLKIDVLRTPGHTPRLGHPAGGGRAAHRGHPVLRLLRPHRLPRGQLCRHAALPEAAGRPARRLPGLPRPRGLHHPGLRAEV